MANVNTPGNASTHMEQLAKVSAIVERLKSVLATTTFNEKVREGRKIRIAISEQEWAELSMYMGGAEMTL